MNARQYRAVLAYDGTRYAGFQRQAGSTPTIQSAVETAITAVTKQAVTVIGAGRTDTGVHASGQVIAFEVGWSHGDQALINAINNALPEDIALQTLERCEGFHPRFDAVSRLYNYTLLLADQPQPLLRHRTWHLRRALDRAAMDEAAGLLIGKHDFAALGKPPQGENTVRTVLVSEWQIAPLDFGVLWTYTVEADAFLQHMVRRIVGALVVIGQGRMSVEAFGAALQAKRLLKVALAPSQGLVLAQVKYADGFGSSTHSDRVMNDEQTVVRLHAGETPAGG